MNGESAPQRVADRRGADPKVADRGQEGSVRLFVYGTLMRGESNHHRMAAATFLGEAATEPGLALVDLGPYPGMVKEGRASVSGELYRVPAATLADLDELEQHPDRYWRTTIRLVGDEPAQAYLYPLERAAGWPRIDSGDWRRRDGATANIPRPRSARETRMDPS